MAPFIVNPDNVREFKTGDAFYKWLKANHDKADEVWIKIHKKGSGLPSITAIEAHRRRALLGLDRRASARASTTRASCSATCRAARRASGARSTSENIARLTKAGRMQPHGRPQVDAAKADGRWDKAYGGFKDDEVPPT